MQYKAMQYTVIYDGACNLCSNLVQLLEQIDRGQQFGYVSMQDQVGLDRYGITAEDCEMGMILLNNQEQTQRWQGADAAEEIGKLMPLGWIFVNAYRGLPGVKWVGDRVYTQVRDNRYAWFGKRPTDYQTAYPACEDNCDRYFKA